MAVMTTRGATRLGVPLPAFGDWTVDDLDGLPDDGLQYELLDGMLLVTPGPVPTHQTVVLNVGVLLKLARTAEVQVFIAPLDWRPDRRTNLQPDALVTPVPPSDAKNITDTLLLAVEVLSPSTRRKDLLLKRSKYEEAGVTSYWVVDPDLPSVTVYELRDGQYATVAVAEGDERVRVDLPFPVEFSPAELLLP